MRLVVITQDEPFYLAKNLRYLIEILPEHSELVACVVNQASPFAKGGSFLQKALRTYRIFGLYFFLHYSIKFIKSKFNTSKSVSQVLQSYQIPKIVLDEAINKASSVARIKAYEPDLLISILGNQIFKAPIIQLAPKGCINLHTALLPKYRGLMPTFWVLKNEEPYTGVSVFFVDKGIDSGPIIVQKRIEIGNKTQAQLIQCTKKLGMEAIAEAVDQIEKDKVELIANDASQKSYFSFPTRADVKVFKQKKKKFF